MSDDTENLVLEHLRAIRAEVADLKRGQKDIKGEIISVRKQLVSLQEDSIRRDETMMALSVSIDRINKRLELQDA